MRPSSPECVHGSPASHYHSPWNPKPLESLLCRTPQQSPFIPSAPFMPTLTGEKPFPGLQTEPHPLPRTFLFKNRRQSTLTLGHRGGVSFCDPEMDQGMQVPAGKYRKATLRHLTDTGITSPVPGQQNIVPQLFQELSAPQTPAGTATDPSAPPNTQGEP